MNIYAFAKSIDLSHDRGGDMRVIGWQIALLRMEMSSQVTERKFRTAYMMQFDLLTRYWAKFGKARIDPYALRWTFTRKFPKDIAQEITTLLEAQQGLPLETAYGLMSFIDDPKEIADKFREEQLGPIPDVDVVPGPDGSVAGQPAADVQAQALNGAQIASIVEVVQGVSDGSLAADSAIQILMVSIPSMSLQQAHAIIDPAVKIDKPAPPPMPPQFGTPPVNA